MSSSGLPPELSEPDRLVARSAAIGRTSCVPAKPGVYAWYFDGLPAGVPLDGTHAWMSRRLLYIGTAPRRPRGTDGKPSGSNLRKRINQHYNAKAYSSTLRRTLGCILGGELGISPQLTPGGRLTYGDGERVLSEWMEEHARVCWIETREPWLLESRLIQNLYLPLNLDGNQQHPFYPTLMKLRHEARHVANRSLSM